VSVAEMIFEKAKSLPGKLQAEALGFVDYLSRRGEAAKEAAAWKQLGTETRALPQVKTISEEDIAAEIADYRQFLRDDPKEYQVYENLRVADYRKRSCCLSSAIRNMSGWRLRKFCTNTARFWCGPSSSCHPSC